MQHHLFQKDQYFGITFVCNSETQRIVPQQILLWFKAVIICPYFRFEFLLPSDLFIPADPEITALCLSCVIDRCAGGECDMEEENLRGNSVGLHQTRLGSSKVILPSAVLLFLLCLCM